MTAPQTDGRDGSELDGILDGYHIVKLGTSEASETDWYELKAAIERYAIRRAVEELEPRHLLDIGGKMINDDQLLIDIHWLHKRIAELKKELK